MKEVARRLADMRIDITRELGKQKSVEKEKQQQQLTAEELKDVDLMKRWEKSERIGERKKMSWQE